ncbi:MAG: UvrB/UvrC motif-containing protein, partial [Thermomicrobiaceae bacterium]|nr:UvrB/UvrC motif-containing protein [Thermomicrobiaceae bacterium]
LDRAHLATIPRAPGVYLMRDAHDRVIYVGKAKNLRARVSSYYSQPLGYTRKMDGLLESIARIETVETGSELEALLLEAQLIRRYRPQYNTQLRNTDSYPYIKIDLANPWPRVALTRQRADDDAVYFGPFRVARAARAAVELIQEVFPLRTCTRSFKSPKSYGSPCISLALGRCLGPCVGAADRDRYRGLVHDVVRFLKGDTSEVIGRLQRELEECAERLDFERAARLRDQIRRVQSLILSQQLLDEAVERGNALIVTPSPGGDGRGFLLVVRGRLWARVEAGPADNDADVAYRLERSWRRAREGPVASVDQDSLDEVHILGRWLRRYAGHPAILPLDGEPLDWLALARAGRALPAPALVFDGRASGEPGGKDDAFSPVEDTW